MRGRFAEDTAAVADLYGCLDTSIESAETELGAELRSSNRLSAQAQVEREAQVARLSRRLGQLRAAERRLVFGRLDLTDRTTLYVGRLGLRPEGRVLVDWRAPAAAAFYQATPACPGPVLRRRQLHLDGRRLVDVNEEVLVPDHQGVDEQADGALGEGSANRSVDELAEGSVDLLTRVLAAPRTGRMGDIVATLQAEQDRIIRSPGQGALVVHGAPGTGKTVVALHRAAYLLYSEPARRAGGVLVVGPNPRFLRYIEQVLPALGETDVVLAQPTDLYPVTEPDLTAEDPTVAQLKADLRMVEVLRRAVAHRQRLLPGPVPMLVDGVEVLLRPEVIRRARDAARASGEPHNQARDIYAEIVLEDLVDQFLTATSGGAGYRDPASGNSDGSADHPADSPTREQADGQDDDRSSRAQALAALHLSVAVRREVNLRWMPLAPEKLLRDLFTSDERLRAAAPDWPAADRALLVRRRDAAWTRDDIALLDEVAAMLGPPPPSAADRAEAAVQAAAKREAVRFASDTLSSYGVAETITAEELAHRYGVDDHLADHRPLAERAAADPSWAYGHVIVDEAQDLTAMQWRMVLRRCPSRSLTIVGDLNQRSGTATRPRVWADVLAPHLSSWREETLTVNYRTPGEHLQLARRRLGETGVDIPDVDCARWGGTVREVDVTDTNLPGLVAEQLDACHGTLAVVTHESGSLAERLPAYVAVLTPPQAKGLEFDTVIVVDPDHIASRLGPGDLYVSLTRATQRLVLARRSTGRMVEAATLTGSDAMTLDVRPLSADDQQLITGCVPIPAMDTQPLDRRRPVRE
ncbi:HelD family protein [Nocardioides sp. URHA0032]|uniref:HelD family protein n=1 Tax=Nocardioides sp. URHA0032 TaxID=1380388 RepID=UPI000A55FBD3|nr:ATP-binding domain-containing protein [Nocardioides sp. URHA0032]